MKMTLKMLSVLFFNMFLSLSVQAQQPMEILVLGASHGNNASDSLHYKEVLLKLVQYHPDLILTEFLTPADYLAMPATNSNKKSQEKSFEYLRRHNPVPIKNTAKQIEKYKAALAKFDNFHRVRMDLALAYFQNHDLGNGLYHLYILENDKKKHFGAKELEYYTAHFGTRDSLQKAGLFRTTSEYCTLVFPLAHQLGQQEIYPIDAQQYDEDWKHSWRLVAYIMHYTNKIAKMDSTTEEAKIVNAIAAAKETIEKEQVAQNLPLYNYLNSDLNARESDILNFYGGPELFGISKAYPESEVKNMMKYWGLRNAAMAANTLAQMKKQNAKRGVVVVGSAHQKWMEDELAKDKNVKIIKYNALQ